MMVGRVLIAAPADGATALYVQRGFEALGWQVKAWDYRRHAAGLAYYEKPRQVAMMTEALQDYASGVDLVLVLKGESIPVAALKAVGERVPVALWHFDPQDGREDWVVERARAASAFFTIAKGLVPYYDFVGVKAHWLLEGADPEAHQPAMGAHQVGQYPVGFVGTVMDVPGREAWLRALGKAFPGLVHLWGSFPGRFSAANYSGSYGVVWHGRAEPGDVGLSAVVSSTGVNLGRDRHPELERSYGARLFRTLAAGGFLLTNRTAGIEEDFKGCLDTYSTDEECVERVEYWLDSPKKRLEVAQRGRDLVLKKHLFRHRVEELLRVMKC